jgi:cytochrome P450
MIQSEKTQIPVGPPDRYSQNEDLRTWLHDNFKRYGDIYKASIFGRDVYVVSSPEFVQHVLRTNWSNYRKGQWIKRVGLLLGNGLMVSEGEFWKGQRRMIQPAFRREVAGTLYNVIS